MILISKFEEHIQSHILPNDKINKFKNDINKN